MNLYFSVGEPSGDQHAAHLIEALRRRVPNIECSGYGGPRMAAAGCRIDYELTNLAVMGFADVVPLLRTFRRLVKDAERRFRESPPDAVVLVDFPGFNWWIARKAKAAGIPVFYYLPPQLWAWAPWRIRKMRKFVDHVLCGLSFEPEWYARRGMPVDYVGHPFFDEVADHRLDETFCAAQRARPGRIVGILPGSRNQEVHKNWPIQVGVMRRLRDKHPDVRFVVASYRDTQRQFCEDWLRDHASDAALPLEFHTGVTPEIISLSECCLMVSGSVSLEMLARRTPAVVQYKGSVLLWILKNTIIQVTSATLPNLMAGKAIFPEHLVVLRPKHGIEVLTGLMDRWLSDPAQRLATLREMDELARRVAQTGATGRAADVILARLGESGAITAGARRAA